MLVSSDVVDVGTSVPELHVDIVNKAMREMTEIFNIIRPVLNFGAFISEVMYGPFHITLKSYMQELKNSR